MLRFAVRNLLSRPARSLLSLLGLTVAIAGMVGLFSVAVGIDVMVKETFDRFPGMLVMQKGAPIPLFSRIPRSWGPEIEQLPGVHVVSAEIWTRVNRVNRKNIVSPPRFLFGADIPAHERLDYCVYRESLTEGRYLNSGDAGKPLTVISDQIAEEFEVGIGDKLTVNNVELEVVGLYYCGSLLLDMAIIVDQELLRQVTRFDPNTVCSFYVEPTGEISNDEIVGWMRDSFRDRSLTSWDPTSLLFGGGLSSTDSDDSTSMTGNPLVDLIRSTDKAIKGVGEPEPEESEASPSSPTATFTVDSPETNEDEDDGPLEIRSVSDWAQQFEQFTADLDIFLTVMTSIGLTIAVLSIVNTMLMSVTERIIEFGILKANGWSRGDVMRLITFESVVLGFAGGIVGCLVGWLLTQFINWNWPDDLYLVASPGLLAFALVFSMALGGLGGLYPAVWATRMMPMDAIRRG